MVTERSKWTFDTSGTGGIGIGLVAAEGGIIKLSDRSQPQRTSRRRGVHGIHLVIRCHMQHIAAFGALAFLFLSSARAQTLHGTMTLVLIDDAGQRSAPLPVLGGTIVISRAEPSRAPGNPVDAIAPDRADIAFDPIIATDKRLLTWIAKSGAKAKAELSSTGDKNAAIYVLWGMTSRNVSITQSQDGAGQTSVVLGALHASINGLSLN